MHLSWTLLEPKVYSSSMQLRTLYPELRNYFFHCILFYFWSVVSCWRFPPMLYLSWAPHLLTSMVSQGLEFLSLLPGCLHSRFRFRFPHCPMPDLNCPEPLQKQARSLSGSLPPISLPTLSYADNVCSTGRKIFCVSLCKSDCRSYVLSRNSSEKEKYLIN